ncbi:MAG: HAMP domain-containing histidine kinase [Pseudobutyrivibrio sp.]|nr:HAMP domain-containing histidine kinase [Pseudobutyrivibrio sp.]
MRKIYKKSSKVILGVLCSGFGLIFIASLILSCFWANYGLYTSTDTFKKSIYDEAGSAYAVWAMAGANDNFNAKTLNKLNCNYGVIESNYSSNLDLNDDSIYEYRNFDTTVPEDAYVEEFDYSDSNYSSTSPKLFNLYNGNEFHSTPDDIYRSFSVDGIGYDLVGQQAFVYANDTFYPIEEDYYSYTSTNTSGTPNTNNIYKKIWENNFTTLENTSETETEALDSNKLYINGNAYAPLSDSVEGYTLSLITDDGADGILDLSNVADLSSIHSELADNNNYVSLDKISTIGTYESDPSLKYYTVVVFPKENYIAAGDFYAQADSIIDAALHLKTVMPIVAIVSFLIAFAAYILLLLAAGHRYDSDEILCTGTNKIPCDLAILLTFVPFYLVFLIITALFYIYDSFNTLIFVFLIALYIVCVITILLISCNLAVNIKLHQLFKNTIIWRLCRILAKNFSKYNSEYKKLCSTIKDTKRIRFIYILVSIIELFFLIVTSSTNVFFFWFIEKIILAVLLHRFLKEYAKIKSATIALAAGDTNSHVELEKMPLYLEEHAKALNEIQNGLNIALNERTKSERMKTELITNVSHDIKTPLTSIINYVDLLEKENISGNRAKEYLEVLDRQSKRLKKLIEDLIEASKASTGNIKFNIEDINAVVLLNQSIGEFTDRLKENNINIVTNFPEKDYYLKADNRYLWRVFDNIMSNIVKYAQPNTRAYIDLRDAENKIEFGFRNISKEELNISADELMERFVRGDKSRYTDGNGLGLSIARSLTESMGGAMNISIDGDLFKVTIQFNKIDIQ